MLSPLMKKTENPGKRKDMALKDIHEENPIKKKLK